MLLAGVLAFCRLCKRCCLTSPFSDGLCACRCLVCGVDRRENAVEVLNDEMQSLKVAVGHDEMLARTEAALADGTRVAQCWGGVTPSERLRM